MLELWYLQCCSFLKKVKKNTCKNHYFTHAYQKSWWYDLQFLRYSEWWTEIGNFGSLFCFITLLKTLKNQNFEKMRKKKLLEITSFHTCEPKITIRWCTVSGIQSDFVILSHFFPEKSKFWKNEKNTWRYHHLTHVYHKWQSYAVWFLRYGVQQTEF